MLLLMNIRTLYENERIDYRFDLLVNSVNTLVVLYCSANTDYEFLMQRLSENPFSIMPELQFLKYILTNAHLHDQKLR